MRSAGVTVRTMSRGDVDQVIEWAAEEGWNPGLGDAVPFHAADPAGFLIAEADDGQPAAAVSVVRYGEDLGFLGLYIARPEYRGRGYGMAVWRAGMERLAGRTVGLDGVVAQQDNYRKSGFVLAHRNVRYQGTVPATGAPEGLTDLAAVPFDRLLAYDRPLFGAPRAAFLSAWTGMPGVVGLAAAGVAGSLGGYAVARPCRVGWKIGPLFADDAENADKLFRGLCAAIPGGEQVILDVPEPNREAMALAARYGLAPVFETARMYAGPPPGLDLGRIFGITSFELG
ncbi:GNAT family N-acetyltransferase [Skermanella mucosa]|uniref:GNAT family N-acetyltransferase n=1 Tax=Skermanella mucosa TaxID=1789672 RepID=UPI00192CB609|nr:GNAT family N-acetyltransferase [Skermanella mucosa]UEM23024.1 GNAT family N-acetyltransferase [Skermanella mucosa]